MLSELVRDVRHDSVVAETEVPAPPCDLASPIKLRATPRELYSLLDPTRRLAVDQLLAESRSLGDSSCDELGDQTQVAFGFGKRTIGFRPSDLK